MTQFIGLDISKQRIDVCILTNKEEFCFEQFENTTKGIKALLNFLQSYKVSLIICEPTGGYEKLVCQVLQDKSYPIHRVHTISFHGFAKSLSFSKNDRIDSYKLAYYGKAMELKANMLFQESHQKLKDWVQRREYLVGQLSNEKRHLGRKACSEVAHNIKDHIAYLEGSIKTLDQYIEGYIENNKEQFDKQQRLCSVPGLGKVLAAKLLAYLPELGDSNFNLNQLSALTGIAPYCRDSGNYQGKRFIRGGRKIPRDALYMAVLTGARKIPLLDQLKQRLLKKGKPCKVALIACMRKLLAILHSLLKRQKNFTLSLN